MIEKILKDEDVSNVKCKTRMDELLKRLATGKSCSDIKGCTDIEKLVKHFNEDGAGGSVGGLSGTGWQFNATGISKPNEEFPIHFNVNFFSMQEKYSSIWFYERGGSEYVCYQNNHPDEGYSPAYRYEYENWQNLEKAFVVFIDGEDIANPELIAWVQANATQVLGQ